MRPVSKNNDESRVADILGVIFKYAAGDLTARGIICDDGSALDGVMVGINILGEELEANVAENKKANDSLRQALDYARTLTGSSPDAILAVDRGLRITEWNPLMEQICGRLRKQAIGQVLDDIPFMQETGEAARIRAGLDGKRVQRKEIAYRIPGSDKESFFESVMAPLRDGTGRIQGAVLRMLDLTERKRAEHAEEMARRDSLADLYNHGTFYTLLKDEIVRMQRFNRSVSLLMLDIDHFKRVNDAHGHRAGDAVLRGLSDLLVRHARAVDRVCRYGGEEFTVILPETDAAAAMQIAERLRVEVERWPFDIGGGTMTSITVSIGVATYPQQADSLEGVITAADVALYAAKQGGRNRSRVASLGVV